MICPNLEISAKPFLQCRCSSIEEIPEVKTGNINQYCATDQYDHCSLYRKKKPGFRQAIYHEVYRAVG
jgi:hypothetical protein